MVSATNVTCPSNHDRKMCPTLMGWLIMYAGGKPPQTIEVAWVTDEGLDVDKTGTFETLVGDMDASNLFVTRDRMIT